LIKISIIIIQSVLVEIFLTVLRIGLYGGAAWLPVYRAHLAVLVRVLESLDQAKSLHNVKL
jgi:hypothetical protein